MKIIRIFFLCAAVIMGGVLNDPTGYFEGDFSGNSDNLLISENVTNPQSLALLADKQAEPQVFISDVGEMFTDEEEAAIRLELEAAARETGWCIGLCTGHRFITGENLYSIAFGEQSGVMLLINRGVAKVVAAGEAAEFVKGERAENICRLTERSLRHKSCRKIPVQLCKSLINFRKKGRGSFDLYLPAFIVALICGMAAGFGTVFLISRRYSLSEPPIVNNYLDVRSIEMYRKTDELLWAKSTRYKNNIIQQALRGEGIFRRRR